jgi:transposase
MNEIRADYTQTLMFPPCIEDWVPEDHPARFVREIVDGLPLKEMGLKVRESEQGRPNYAVDLLLKVWVYGYLERIRSTRKLEKACRQDVALIWLTGMNYPDHNTLWRFWRDNRKAMKQIFCQTVEIAGELGLVEMVLHAVDGTKITSRGSTHEAWGRKRFEKVLKDLDQEIERAMKEVEQEERSESGESRLPAELADKVKLRGKIQEKLAQLKEKQREHMNPAEPEAEMMKNHEGTRLAYNAQAVVEPSGIIVAAAVSTDQNDKLLLVPMLNEVKENLEHVAEETVADAGYFSGEQLAASEEANCPVIVNLQGMEAGTGGEYDASRFLYDEKRDCCICPRGQELPYQCTVTPSDRRYAFRRYRCKSYKDCPVRWQCSKEKRGRSVRISPYLGAIQRQQEKQRDQTKIELLKKRMGIVEPAFARIKHLLDFRRWTMFGLKKVQAQWFFVCAVANLLTMAQISSRQG